MLGLTGKEGTKTDENNTSINLTGYRFSFQILTSSYKEEFLIGHKACVATVKEKNTYSTYSWRGKSEAAHRKLPYFFDTEWTWPPTALHPTRQTWKRSTNTKHTNVQDNTSDSTEK